MADGAFHENLPLVLVDNDVVGDAQPQSGAFAGRFGREEGIEDSAEVLRRDAGAVVFDLADDGRAVLVRAEGDLPPGRAFLGLDGLGCVDQDVQEDLVDLPGTAEDVRNVTELRTDIRPILDLVARTMSVAVRPSLML